MVDSVAALCPNCHRRAHHGVDRDKTRTRLETSVSAFEKAYNEGRLQVVVAAILVNERGDVWIGRRSSGTLEGHWEFPGGKVEEDEDLESALRREIQEELGVDLHALYPFAMEEEDYGRLHVRLFAFLTPEVNQAPNSNSHCESKWVPPSGLGELRLAQVDSRIAERLMALAR